MLFHIYVAEYATGSKNSISKSWKVAISVVLSVVVCFLLVLLVYLKAKRKRKGKLFHLINSNNIMLKHIFNENLNYYSIINLLVKWKSQFDDVVGF